MSEMLKGLAENAAVLLALGLVYDTFAPTHPARRHWARQVVLGLVLGAICLTIMLTTVPFAPGIVFDTRTVFLSVAGLFFGWIPAGIACVMAGAYRIIMGGTGLPPGLLTILSATTIGLVWRRLRSRRNADPSVCELYMMGLLVHAVMLLCMFSLPWPKALATIDTIWAPVILIHPVATALLGTILAGQQRRRRQALELAASESRYRSYVDNAPDGVFITNTDGYYLEVNPAACVMTGFAEEELIGRRIVDIVPEFAREEARAHFRRVLDTGRSHGELAFTRKNGGVGYWEVTAVRLSDDRFLELTRDVTERRNALTALHRSEERFRHLFECMAQGVVCQSADGAITDCNLAAEEILGVSRDQIMGRTSMDSRWTTVDEEGVVLPGDHHPAMIALKTGEPVFRVPMGVFNPVAERFRWLLVSAAPFFRMGESKPCEVFATFEDVTELRETAHALSEANERMTMLLDSISDAFFATDRAFVVTYYNRAAERVLRRPVDDVLGRKLFDAFSEMRGSVFEMNYREAMAAQRPMTFETFLNAPPFNDWYDVRIYPSMGGVAAVLGVTTERHEAQQALRESEGRYRLLFEEMLGGCALHEIITDEAGEPADYRFLAVNESFARLTGINANGIIGKTVRELMPGIEPLWIQRYGRVALTGQSDQFEDYSSGTGRYFEVRAFSPEPRKFAVIFHDITERRRAEEALRRSEELHRLLAENASDTIWMMRLDETFIYHSPAVMNLRGFTPEEANGIALEQSLAPDSFALVQRIFANEYAKPEAERWSDGIIELEMFRKDGSTVWTDVSVRAVRDADGKVVGLQGCTRDITERRKNENEKAQLEEQLRDALRLESIGRLAGGVAHDFNNMLSPILGYADMLVEDLPPDSELREEAMEIAQAALRARDLTRQLLAFARRQTLEIAPLDLNDVILGLEKMLRRTIREDVHIKFTLSPSLGPIEADVGQIEQILLNLVINAQDAMPRGGHVFIETNVNELDHTYASIHKDVIPGKYAMVAVSDTGIGMSDETIDKIFEPFYTTKALGRGTGLGLSTVYGIVKQHNGHIHVYSEVGHGATFKVYLPMLNCAIPEPSPETQAERDLNGIETILVVEDQTQVRLLVAMVLRRKGYFILEAAGGESALRMAQSHEGPLDLLLTDVIMPDMNGRELHERLTMERPGLKVLYMSGYTANVISHHGVLDPGVHFLHKPFAPRTLAEAVRDALTN